MCTQKYALTLAGYVYKHMPDDPNRPHIDENLFLHVQPFIFLLYNFISPSVTAGNYPLTGSARIYIYILWSHVPLYGAVVTGTVNPRSSYQFWYQNRFDLIATPYTQRH